MMIQPFPILSWLQLYGILFVLDIIFDDHKRVMIGCAKHLD